MIAYGHCNFPLSFCVGIYGLTYSLHHLWGAWEKRQGWWGGGSRWPFNTSFKNCCANPHCPSTTLACLHSALVLFPCVDWVLLCISLLFLVPCKITVAMKPNTMLSGTPNHNTVHDSLSLHRGLTLINLLKDLETLSSMFWNHANGKVLNTEHLRRCKVYLWVAGVKEW